MQRSRIIGTGAKVPARVVTNYDLAEMMPTSHEWIVAKTGIVERRVAEAEEATSDLAVAAARQALENAEVKVEDIDLILVATSTPDHPLPATAAIVQHKLGARRAVGFDLNSVCSSFVYGLTAADAYIRTGMAKNVLLIGADTYSKILDWKDRRSTPFFGDGAGAAVLRADSGDSGILSFDLGVDGSGSGVIIVPAGGSRKPVNHDVIEAREQYFYMDGPAVKRFAVETFPASVRRALDKAELTTDDVDLLIPHQANLRILEESSAKLNIPMEKVVVTLDRYGNTAAASIPMALHEAVDAGRVKEGDTIAMCGFGGGLAWGSAVVKW